MNPRRQRPGWLLVSLSEPSNEECADALAPISTTTSARPSAESGVVSRPLDRRGNRCPQRRGADGGHRGGPRGQIRTNGTNQVEPTDLQTIIGSKAGETLWHANTHVAQARK